jgi:hypothetical protein
MSSYSGARVCHFVRKWVLTLLLQLHTSRQPRHKPISQKQRTTQTVKNDHLASI